jgi:hypothetical protein
MKLIFKQILDYKYELMSVLGGVVSMSTNSPTAMIVLIGGLFGMIANTISPTVKITVSDQEELKKAFRITYKEINE